MLRAAPPNRLRALRRAAGFTGATKLAFHLGVDPSTVFRWELGTSPIPDERKIELAEMFAVSIPFLMGWPESWPESHRNGNGRG